MQLRGGIHHGFGSSHAGRGYSISQAHRRVEVSTMSVIVQGLTKHYSSGAAPAISDVSFEAPSGGITALLGPSGAGKSTVLRAIAGLELVDQGRITIEGSDCSHLRVQDRNVGFVFQNYALFEHMTIAEN